MLCPRDGAALDPLVVGVHALDRCPTCRGVWGSRATLEAMTGARVVSRAAALALDGLTVERGIRCPRCDGPLEHEESRELAGHEILACRACAALWLDEETFAALRRQPKEARPEVRSIREATRSSPPGPEAEHVIALPPARLHASIASGEAGAPRDASSPPPAVEHSVFAPGPARELAVLAGLFVLAWLLVHTGFGEALAILARIQFHELGHALVAWSTGRSALPLPFGWTSWSFERSWLLVAMELLFPVLLAIHGAREKKAIPIVVAASMASVFVLGLVTPLEVSEPWLVAGGMFGEALLPALALLAFHLPLPHGFRWDFFRWPLALFALVAVASVTSHFLDIGSGTSPLPMGSFVTGRTGDGDLERLVTDYGWASASLRPMFHALGASSLVLALVVSPAVFALRAALGRRETRGATPRP